MCRDLHLQGTHRPWDAGDVTTQAAWVVDGFAVLAGAEAEMERERPGGTGSVSAPSRQMSVIASFRPKWLAVEPHIQPIRG